MVLAFLAGALALNARSLLVDNPIAAAAGLPVTPLAKYQLGDHADGAHADGAHADGDHADGSNGGARAPGRAAARRLSVRLS